MMPEYVRIRIETELGTDLWSQFVQDFFLNIKDYFSTDNKWHWSDIFDFFSNRTCQEHSIKREASSISKQLENNQAIWKSNSSYFKALTGSISYLASFWCLGGYWWTLMRILGKNKILFSWFGPAHFNIFFNNFWQFLTTHF